MSTPNAKSIIDNWNRIGAIYGSRVAQPVERRVQSTTQAAAAAVAPVASAVTQALPAAVREAQAMPAPSDAMVPGVRQQISTTGARLDVNIRRAIVLPSPPPNAALAAAHKAAASMAGSAMVARPGDRQVVTKSGAGQRTMVSPLGAKAAVVRATNTAPKK